MTCLEGLPGSEKLYRSIRSLGSQYRRSPLWCLGSWLCPQRQGRGILSCSCCCKSHLCFGNI